MAEKSDPNPGHAMFGLNEAEPTLASPEGTSVYGKAPSGTAARASGSRVLPLLVVLLLVLSGGNLYLFMTARSQSGETLSKHSDQLDLLTRRLDSSDSRYAQLSGRFQVTTERLGLTQQELNRARTLAKDIQTQQQATVNQLNDAIAKKASAEQLNQLQEEANAKFGALSGDIAGTRKDLEATKQALEGTKGELTGAIARTHDELVALAHKTDRDYFEFRLVKKGATQKLGSVLIELQKTNLKKNQYTVNLVFDDRPHPYKDKTANEPLFFYPSGAPSALELVVNKLSKDSIAGYVSAPKGFFAGVENVLAARPGL